MSGRRVGPYLLLSEVGRGGMGSVWLARRDDGKYDARVAIKLLASAWLGHEGEIRFRHEGMLLARLDHPNIARLLDAGVTEQGEPYLVLEYVEGARVDDYCRQAGLNIRGRIELFLELLSAVGHAHRNLVVHRDIKPANVLVNPEGRAKLLDFGIGKLLESDAALTRSGHAMLTPEYAAPEQLLGEAVTTSTDIYALGLLLYVLLTGRLPYQEATSPAELLRRITTGAMPLPSSIAMTQQRSDAPPLPHRQVQRELRGDLDNIVLKAMHVAPEQRYADVGAFAADLRRFLNHEPVSARSSTTWYRLAKFARRNRVAVLASAAALVAASVATVITITQTLEARRQREAAANQERTVQLFTDFLNLSLFSEGGPDRPALSMNERVERAAAMLEKQYVKDPGFAATMLIQLADRIGLPGGTATPERLMLRAYELAEQAGNRPVMIAARCGQVQQLVYAAKQVAAEAALQQAKLLLAQSDPPVEVRVECLIAEAYLQQLRGKQDVSIALLQRGGRLLEQAGMQERGIYADLLSFMTNAYIEQRNYGAAIEVSQRAAALELRIGRGDTSEHLTTLQNLATLLQVVGEINQSLTDRERVNQLARRFYEIDGMPPAMLNNYVVVLLRMERPRQALEVIDANIERIRAGDNPAALLQALHIAAWAHLRLEEWAAAERALDEAQPLMERKAGPPSLLSQITARRAELAFGRGEEAAARKYMDTALAMGGYGTEQPERSLPRVLITATGMALAMGRFADAETYASTALRLTSEVARGPLSSADVGESLLLLAKARAGTQPLGRQRELLERAIQCLTNSLTASHPLTTEARELLTRARLS